MRRPTSEHCLAVRAQPKYCTTSRCPNSPKRLVRQLVHSSVALLCSFMTTGDAEDDSDEAFESPRLGDQLVPGSDSYGEDALYTKSGHGGGGGGKHGTTELYRMEDNKVAWDATLDQDVAAAASVLAEQMQSNPEDGGQSALAPPEDLTQVRTTGCGQSWRHALAPLESHMMLASRNHGCAASVPSCYGEYLWAQVDTTLQRRASAQARPAQTRSLPRHTVSAHVTCSSCGGHTRCGPLLSRCGAQRRCTTRWALASSTSRPSSWRRAMRAPWATRGGSCTSWRGIKRAPKATRPSCLACPHRCAPLCSEAQRPFVADFSWQAQLSEHSAHSVYAVLVTLHHDYCWVQAHAYAALANVLNRHIAA